MNNLFGIKNDLIKKALIDGIKVKKNGEFVDATGFISLTFINQYNKFVFAYGSGASDAGWVFVEDYEKEWILK